MPFTFYRQLNEIDCGPTCLRMIAKYYGKHYNADTLRQKAGFSKQGVSLLGISETAEKIRFRTRGVQINFTKLIIAPLPAILHWNQNHFVVLTSLNKRTATVADPGRGIISYDKEKFLQHWISNQTDEWMLKYVLKSPINGKITFIIPLQENQYLKADKLLGYINPNDSHFYAEAVFSQYNFAEVHTGLSVQLRFDAYPYQEMSFVEGKLDYISSILSDSGFLVTVGLTNGLITNNRKIIPYKDRLRAQALVITQNLRVANPLYYNIIKSTSAGN